MQLEELISGARDVVSAKRVYGDPYEKNGLTVIPAATVRGGGGGGGGRLGEGDDGESGAGGGFGLMARPSGAWIIEDGRATWKPAIDVNRIVLGGQIIALTVVVVGGRILLAHARPGGGLQSRLRGMRPRRQLRRMQRRLPRAVRR